MHKYPRKRPNGRAVQAAINASAEISVMLDQALRVVESGGEGDNEAAADLLIRLHTRHGDGGLLAMTCHAAERAIKWFGGLPEADLLTRESPLDPQRVRVVNAFLYEAHARHTEHLVKMWRDLDEEVRYQLVVDMLFFTKCVQNDTLSSPN